MTKTQPDKALVQTGSTGGPPQSNKTLAQIGNADGSSENNRSSNKRTSWMSLLPIVLGLVSILILGLLVPYESRHVQWLLLPAAAGWAVAGLDLLTWWFANVRADKVLIRPDKAKGPYEQSDVSMSPDPEAGSIRPIFDWESIYDWRAPGVAIVVLFLTESWLGELGPAHTQLAMWFALIPLVGVGAVAVALGLVHYRQAAKAIVRVVAYFLVLMAGYFMPAIKDTIIDAATSESAVSEQSPENRHSDNN